MGSSARTRPAVGAIAVDGRKVIPPTLNWRRAPNYDEVLAVYPKKAKDAHISGLVSLQCAFTGKGTLKGCEVMREEPAGYGFATAAKSLTKLFEAPDLSAESKDFKWTKFVVQLPFAFVPEMLTGREIRGKPTLVATPTADELGGVFKKAPKDAKTIRVALGCTILQGGGMADCAVKSEEPAGHEYGEEALKAAPSFRFSAWSMEGYPVVGGTVIVRSRSAIRQTSQEPR